jgi:chromatin remodeling complex protein RSC6
MKRSLLQAKFGIGRNSANRVFSEPMQPDDALSAVVGSKPLPRNELIKKLWGYIREHGLQDQNKKMFINADATLQPIFDGRRQVTIFELTKLMSGHLRPRVA